MPCAIILQCPPPALVGQAPCSLRHAPAPHTQRFYISPGDTRATGPSTSNQPPQPPHHATTQGVPVSRGFPPRDGKKNKNRACFRAPSVLVYRRSVRRCATRPTANRRGTLLAEGRPIGRGVANGHTPGLAAQAARAISLHITAARHHHPRGLRASLGRSPAAHRGAGLQTVVKTLDCETYLWDVRARDVAGWLRREGAASWRPGPSGPVSRHGTRFGRLLHDLASDGACPVAALWRL